MDFTPDDDYFEDSDDMNESEEDEEEDKWYGPEEPSRTKWNVVVCERQPRVRSKFYLVYGRYKQYSLKPHPVYFGRIEIAQCIYLPSYECIAIFKTVWLKIIQRTWKKIVRQRMMERAKFAVLRSREISLQYTAVSGLRGMLSSLL